jgi:hypothetical protein
VDLQLPAYYVGAIGRPGEFNRWDRFLNRRLTAKAAGILEKVTRAQTTLKNVRLYDVLDSLVPDSAQARLICPDLTAIHQQRTILAASIPLVALRVSTTNLALLTMPA